MQAPHTDNQQLRSPRIYEKSPKQRLNLIELLQERGLEVESLDEAEHYLKYIGYYRLIGYLRWFQTDEKDRTTHLYKTGTTFKQILDHYVFDRELRVLIFDAIERIEVAFKSAISNTMSEKYQDSHWFLKRYLFENPSRREPGRIVQSHDSIIQDICRQVERSKKQLFISHYYKNYDEPFLPHTWAVFEVLDFGAISKIYQALHFKDRELIAKHFDQKRATIESWVRSLSTLRNFCAHHSRIWNNSLPNEPPIPSELAHLMPNPKQERKQAEYVAKRFYSFAIVLWTLVKIVAPESKWTFHLLELFQRYPDVSKAKLGFPDGWEKHEFWGLPTEEKHLNDKIN